ncbi:MAG: hypothetical protein A2Y62_17455 [Candidatus Fischerbacteria bacterium RBG_13_37_8]|uniref:Metallo-beta-lactamase domain-containing protein n=1 Tax=Candidatus Fischerbacteria bacterium RBG_13_37_8 TaxID=1817863 RepID=A0A1F5VKS2_9BACT|nr:MAG: hypothetical protein A2Y62_17455 [Candidatus Fischerbacteria bacterium RBG_13_37_8]
MHKYGTILLLIAFCLAGIAHGSGNNGIPEITYERYSDRVLIVKTGEQYFDKIVAIAAKKGIVVIDTGIAPSLAAEYRKIIEREFGRKDFAYIINTHYHYDHSNGNQAFADAKIIGHERSVEGMKEYANDIKNIIARGRDRVAQWKDQYKTMEPASEQAKRLLDTITSYDFMCDDVEKNFISTPPTITFNDRMKLNLGDITLDLVYFGEGRHTGDDILIHCPEEKILFTGDLFYYASIIISPRLPFDAERWISSLNYVLQDPSTVKYVSDMHNKPMTGTFITLFRDYLVDMQKNLAEAKKQNLLFDEVQKQFAYDKKFTYLEKSEIPIEQLKQQHEVNLRFMWYHLKGVQSAATQLDNEITASGITAALKKFKQMRSAPPDTFYYDERELNLLAYRLLGANQISEALEVFKINVELYPQSWNVYDSLAEAYMKNDQNDLAIKNYRKSLELNPDNTNAVNYLKQLEK